jgi:nucleoside-diphosphate-sugar epimerase
MKKTAASVAPPAVPEEGVEREWDSSPSRYIARVSLATGQEVPGPIDPEDLLVHAHRDKHPVDVTVQYLASRIVDLTGNEATVRDALRRINAMGGGVARLLGSVTRSPEIERSTRRLIGVADRNVFYRFRELTHLSERAVKERVVRLQKVSETKLEARGRTPRLRVLLTGATGFLGKEILFQIASDRNVAEVVCVVRPEKIRDPKTKEVLKVLSPQERGVLLLRRIGITGTRAKKFRFVDGDIERPELGIAADELSKLKATLTHVIHCAASVSFDDSYENSFRANVLGCKNALAFSQRLQDSPGSPFIAHIAIETSYIHGRKRRSMAQEDALVFPRHFYNNFYELTKAMASMETDRAMIEGLRVAQLLPAIVIGDSRTGNNRGDTKVVNAPINAFGRAKELMDEASQDMLGQAKSAAIAALANTFPSDPSAELNLVPVDRVVAGIVAALRAPEAIGARIHLATDNRIRAEDVIRVTREELGVKVRLADPTLYRNLTLPLVSSVLNGLGQPKLANVLRRLSTIFGGYGEWGQPIHQIGNDVRILGLPLRRPSTEHAFRMLCRHNKYVQEFGQVKDQDEIARREKLWAEVVSEIELESGHEIGALPPPQFRRLLLSKIDIRTFERARRRALSA